MTSTTDIFSNYVLPVFAIGLVNWMFCAPLKTLRQQNKIGSLGSLNPLPWVFMFGNCLAWVVYAMVNEMSIDYKIVGILGNGPGLILSIYLNLCACKLQYQDYMSAKLKEEFVKFLYEQGNSTTLSIQQQQCRGSKSISDVSSHFKSQQKFSHLIPLVANLSVNDAIAPANHETSVVIMSAFWLIVITCLVFIPMTAGVRTYTVAIIGNMLLVFFYAAPLSTIMTVLRTRSSATIHVPTMVLNTVNSSFWCVYALVQNDPWQYVPNGIGSIVGLIQIALACIFPNNYIEDDDFSDQSELFDDESNLLSNDGHHDDSFLIGNTFALRKNKQNANNGTTNSARLMHSTLSMDDDIDNNKIELSPYYDNNPQEHNRQHQQQQQHTNNHYHPSSRNNCPQSYNLPSIDNIGGSGHTRTSGSF